MPATRKQPVAPPSAPGAAFQPAALLLVSSAEQLKTISDPLRIAILESVGTQALTVKQIAARLSQPATKLYYHVSALEEAGFVVVVDTRVKSGIVEKYYRVAADTIQVDRTLFNQSESNEPSLEHILSVVFDSTIADLQHSYAAGLLGPGENGQDVDQSVILTRSLFQLRAADVPRFVEKFRALLKELDAEQDQTDTLSYACTLAFYPQAPAKTRKKTKRSA